MKITPFESSSLAVAKLTVKKLDLVDGEPQEVSADYTLVLDFNALAKAQQEIGRDFCDAANWNNLDATQLSALCWCAFARFHPEVTLEEVRQMLQPAQRWELWSMLLELCFPGSTERIQKALEEEAKAKQNGGAQNPPEPLPGEPIAPS